ncbi:hypothetical protein [Phytoactinopolyspora mesophila]|uniref:Uncharacterized protein n=1 Tax=Phytoactinopolyspora mesophila TaxID=2650750 RepID=A0A7K3MAL9_9ACTN|nr:hypothetical protein [Phytoactinopolyspora mesophila]NDL60077.1 hypothetical protein [Phytoactinopolyspora mesophila]
MSPAGTKTRALPEEIEAIVDGFPDEAARGAAKPRREGDVWALTVTPSSELYSFTVSKNVNLVLCLVLKETDDPVHGQRANDVEQLLQAGPREKNDGDHQEGSVELEYIDGLTVLLRTEAPIEIRVVESEKFHARIRRGATLISVGGRGVELEPGHESSIEQISSVSSIIIQHKCTIATHPNETVEKIGFIGQSACLVLDKIGITANNVIFFDPAKTVIELLPVSDSDVSTLTVNEPIKGGHWKVRKNTVLKAENGVERARFSGRGLLELGPGSYSESLTGNGRQMKLGARRAVVSRLSGRWRIRDAREASLSGEGAGFAILGLSLPRQRGRTDRFDGAVVTNFSLPRLETRRRVLASMTGAYHLSPNADRIPGSGSKYHELSLRLARKALKQPTSLARSVPRVFTGRLDPEVKKALDRDAEFVGELSRLAHQHGAPGSVRTRISWCAYRLQHLTAGRLSERALLIVYRCLGYGEKPAPAFLTWILLALILVPTVAVFDSSSTLDASVQGFHEYIRQAAEMALGPLGTLSGIGTSAASTWDYALRTVIAIPLVTGGLALRNYLKRPRG